MDSVDIEGELPPPAVGPKRENSFGVDAVKGVTKRLSGNFEFAARLLEKDTEAGNNKSKLENSLNNTVRSKSFKQKCLGCWGSVAMGVVVLLILGAMGRYAFAGRFAPHAHYEGMIEFHPPKATGKADLGNYDLGPLQREYLRAVEPGWLTDAEVDEGHVHTRVALLDSTLTGAKMDQVGSTEVVVDLDKLSQSMRSYLTWKQETCVSAPHVGVPVRAVQSQSTGTMLNPTVWKKGRETTEVTFRSPLGEIRLPEAPLTLEVDYISQWGAKGRRRNRKLLKDVEAVCVYAALHELGWEDGGPALRDDL